MREHSAGGVVTRQVDGRTEVALIRPQGRPEGHWVLPKGLVEAGERPVDAAVREVFEETGLRAEAIASLPSSNYIYRRASERVFKIVEWWLMRALDGEIGAIEEAMRVEVSDARWFPLDEAQGLLAYPGERALIAPAREAGSPGGSPNAEEG
jgi:ADP-ribose pyrophosphatase YjhB (NUDIX family)